MFLLSCLIAKNQNRQNITLKRNFSKKDLIFPTPSPVNSYIQNIQNTALSCPLEFSRVFNSFITELGWCEAGQPVSGRLTLVLVGVGSVGIANMLANVGQIEHHTTGLIIMIITCLSPLSPLYYKQSQHK